MTTFVIICDNRRMAKKSNPNETVSVRIGKRRYELLVESAKGNGHTLTWLLNYIVDLYFQEQAAK